MPDNAPSADSADRPAPQPREVEISASLARYWRSNVLTMAFLLVIWAAAGLGCGVLFADRLNAYKIGGYPLGFWFAQQGSIIVFVLIILIYAIALNRLDAKHHREIEAIKARRGEGRS